jgi:hypothetical protein
LQVRLAGTLGSLFDYHNQPNNPCPGIQSELGNWREITTVVCTT